MQRGAITRVEYGHLQLNARDDNYASGGIGLTADAPAIFQSVRVVADSGELKRIAGAVAARERQEAALMAENPKPVVWSRANLKDFGVGRNVRFGDLNRDGQIDVLIGQVLHHGPKDRNSEISCLTAMTFEGEVLWQIGEPDPGKDHLTNDVGFQVHDLDGDGINEVVYCMNSEIVVAEGATGETLFSNQKRPLQLFDLPGNGVTARMVGITNIEESQAFHTPSTNIFPQGKRGFEMHLRRFVLIALLS